MKRLLISIFCFFLVIFCCAQQKKMLIVGQHGEGYPTIQEAVHAVRDFYESPVTIFVHKGIYHEKLNIPSWKHFIHIVGEDRDSTIITNDDYSGKRNVQNEFLTPFNTYTSYTVLVAGNDCVIENLTIQNTAGEKGQAVALHIDADRTIVRNCKILGWQDTFYLARAGSRNFIDQCFISGSTDFIFGAATAVFSKCTIESLKNSYITAPSNSYGHPYGFVFLNCDLRAKNEQVNQVYLGRPWRSNAKAMFYACNLGSHIAAEGWDPWNRDTMFPDKYKTAVFLEINCRGEGFKQLSKRVPWSKQILNNNYKQPSLSSIFTDWKPTENSN